MARALPLYKGEPCHHEFIGCGCLFNKKNIKCKCRHPLTLVFRPEYIRSGQSEKEHPSQAGMLISEQIIFPSLSSTLSSCSSDSEESACNTGDLGFIPGSGRSPGEGHGNPLQRSCLENPMDRGAWRATVHGVAKSWTRLSN